MPPFLPGWTCPVPAGRTTLLTVHSWKLGLPWIAAGLVLIGAMLIGGTVAFGDSDDPEGRDLAWLVTGFWLVVLASAALMVIGMLRILRNLGRRGALVLALFTFLAMLLAVALHNLVYAVTGQEEGFFFLVALFVGPVVLVAALLRAIWPSRARSHLSPTSGRLAPRH